MSIVTNKQYEKEEEDFRAKKKKVPFGGASEHIKLMVELREKADQSNREHEQEQIREARQTEYADQIQGMRVREYQKVQDRETQENAEAMTAQRKAEELEREKQEDEEWAMKQQAKQEQEQQPAAAEQKEQEQGRSM